VTFTLLSYFILPFEVLFFSPAHERLSFYSDNNKTPVGL